MQVEQIKSDELPTNLSLVNQKLYYEHEQNILSDSALCSECDEPAIYYCKSCKPGQRELCEDCKRHHLKVNKTKHHSVVLLKDVKEDLKTESLQDKAKKRESWLCEIHKEEDINARVCYYCSECDKLLCTHCTLVGRHNNHAVYFIKHLVEEPKEGEPNLKGTMKHCVDETNQVLSTFREAIEGIEALMNNLDAKLAETKEVIAQSYDEKLDILKKKRDELNRAVDNIAKKKQDILKAQLEEFKRIGSTLQNRVSFAQEILASFTPEEYVFLHTNVKCELKRLCAKYSPYDCSIRDNDVIEFQRNTDTDLTDIGAVSSSPYGPAFKVKFEDAHGPYMVQNVETVFTVTCQDITGTNLSNCNLSVRLVSLTKEDDNPAIGQVDLVAPGHYTAKVIPQWSGRHQLHVYTEIRSQKLYVCNNPPNTPIDLYIAPHPADELRTLNSLDADGQLEDPWGVALNDNGDIVVSDSAKHCLFIFRYENEQFNFIRHIGEEGDGELEFNTPLGIAFNPVNGEIIVADNNNDRIHCIKIGVNDCDRIIGKAGSQKGEFFKPTGVAVRKNGDIYIADSMNQRIQCFSCEGQILRTFEGWSTQERFFEPYALTFDHLDRLLVAERACNRIQIFKVDHDKLEREIKIGVTSQGQPFGLACSKNSGYVFVSNFKSHQILSEIQIFKQNGELVVTYDIKDCGFRSLSVLNDHYLLIADKLHHILQVYAYHHD